jgi:DNA topoisomerase-1
LLEQHFPDLVNLQFTAQMEQVLDDIATGNEEGIPYLKTFYLGDHGLEQQVKSKEEEIDPRNIHALELDDLGVRVRVGRFGAYLERENNGEPVRVSLPDAMPPADLNDGEIERLLREKTEGPTALGYHPQTDEPIFLLNGPYGPYVQLGTNGDSGKPRRVSLPKTMKPETVTLATALDLLQLPRVLGDHPDSGKKIEAGIGRFGPFVRHDGEYRSLSKEDNVLTVDLARALELLAQEKGQRRAAKAIRELGAHPEDGELIAIYEGRYGPYVKHGKVNASLPKEVSIEALTMKEALELIGQRKAQPKKPRTRKKK